jgi:hypothetical protein
MLGNASFIGFIIPVAGRFRQYGAGILVRAQAMLQHDGEVEMEIATCRGSQYFITVCSHVKINLVPLHVT